MSLAVLLFIVFLILKLVGVIAWSWWLVTLPLLIAMALNLIFLPFFGISFGTLMGFHVGKIK